jgi:hypothetical protein
MKDTQEIEEAAERAAVLHRQAENNGSRYRGMTYEQGVRDALDWALENIDEDPTKPE